MGDEDILMTRGSVWLNTRLSRVRQHSTAVGCTPHMEAGVLEEGACSLINPTVREVWGR